MTQQETLSTLNGLIETSIDGQKGFLNAAKHAHAPKLRSLFSEFAAECASSTGELRACVMKLGGTAETSGTTTGALHRGWTNLRTSLTSDDDLALVEECERGEDHAKAQYARAMKGDHAAEVRMLLQRQHEGAVRHHDRVRDLRNEMKANAKAMS